MSNIASALFCVVVYLFLQDPSQAKAAQENGAAFVGGEELVQQVSYSNLMEVKVNSQRGRTFQHNSPSVDG